MRYLMLRAVSIGAKTHSQVESQEIPSNLKQGGTRDRWNVTFVVSCFTCAVCLFER